MRSLFPRRAALAAVAAVVAAPILAAAPATATSIPDAGFVYDSDTTCGVGDSVRIVGYRGEVPKHLDVPAAIDGRKVTSMSSQPSDDVVGFAGAGIQTLTLPATLVCIEAQAFENNDIATLQLPDSVRVVATGAFARNRISTLSVAEAGDGVGAPFLVQSPSLTVTRDAFGDWLPLSELLEWDIDGKSTEWTVADTPALPDGVGYDADRRAFRIDDSITSFTFAATMTDGHSIGSALIQYTVTIAAAAPTSGGAPSSPTGVPAPLPLDADVPATGESGS